MDTQYPTKKAHAAAEVSMKGEFLMFRPPLELHLQSAHPRDLRMKKTVYNLIQTNGVLTAKQIGNVTYTQ